MNIKILALFFAALTLYAGSGCTEIRTIEFKVIDAGTGKPLAFVQTQVHGHLQYVIGPKSIERNRDLPNTGADGVAIARDLDTALTYEFWFTLPGYYRASARIFRHANNVAVNSQAEEQFLPPDYWARADSVVIVPMRVHPRTEPLPVTRRSENGEKRNP